MRSESLRLCATIFLGGPIQHAHCDASEFDAKLRHCIGLLYDFLSTSYRVLSAHVEEGFGERSTLTSHDIVKRDYAWMSLCDVFVAVLPDALGGLPIRTDGTLIELGWACALGKPIMLLPDQVPLQTSHSHLLRGLSAVGNVHVWPLPAAVENPGSLVEQLDAVLAEARTRRTGVS